MSPDQCFCRGAGICDNNHHICENCTCGHDGAPQTTTAGWVNPSPAREAAWLEKQEANR